MKKMKDYLTKKFATSRIRKKSPRIRIRIQRVKKHLIPDPEH
jgi:hypothetical protein